MTIIVLFAIIQAAWAARSHQCPFGEEGMRNFFHDHSGYTGRMMEYEVLGCSCPVPSPIKYKQFSQAAEEVRKNQPAGWDPMDPPRKLANDLHAEICLSLGLEDWSELCLFTAIGTTLDQFHGVDAFFQFGGHIATIDLTMDRRRKIRNGYKAHFVVEADDFTDRGRRKRLASEIAEKLTKGETIVSARFGTLVA